VALINHSCDPNAVVVFPRSSSKVALHEPLMQVVALREIAAGEEASPAVISWNLNEPTVLRS
jgi:SET and MYND domain-containing protein